MDRLTALNVFRQAVVLGSFAAVSRRLGLSPASVSKNIAELEAHLGVRLLNRTTRRMSLTEAGTLYFDRVSRVLDDLDAADGLLDPLRQTPSGHLRISAPVTLTLMTPLSRVLPEFLTRHPDVSVELSLDDRRVNVIEDGYDLAIRAVDTLEDSSLVARRLMTTPHVVCGAPSYFERVGVPDVPADLAAHECVLFPLSGHPKEWAFHRGDQSVKVPVRGRYQATSSFAVRDALSAGFGVSLMPWIYVRDDVADGRLRTVLDDWSATDLSVFAIYPSSRHMQPKLRAMLDFIVHGLRGVGERSERTGLVS